MTEIIHKNFIPQRPALYVMLRSGSVYSFGLQEVY